MCNEWYTGILSVVNTPPPHCALPTPCCRGLAALGAPLVGLLAERWFGWDASSQGSATTADPKNADALSSALLLCMIVPWFLCFVFYTFLHLTYPADKEYALAQLQEEEGDAVEVGYEAVPHETVATAVGRVKSVRFE